MVSPIRSYRSLEKGARRIVLLGAIAIIALALVAGLGVAIGLIARGDAHASCQFWHDTGEIAPAPSTSQVGLLILADARKSYYNGSCGPRLTPADPKLYPYLPLGDR